MGHLTLQEIDFRARFASTVRDPAASWPPPRGSLRPGDLLASWVAHDLVHVRQIVKNRYAYWMERAEPYRVGYAGPW